MNGATFESVNFSAISAFKTDVRGNRSRECIPKVVPVESLLGLNACRFGEGLKEGLLGNDGAHIICSGEKTSWFIEIFSLQSIISWFCLVLGNRRKERSSGIVSLKIDIKYIKNIIFFLFIQLTY